MARSHCAVNVVKGHRRWSNKRILIGLENPLDKHFNVSLFRHQLATGQLAAGMGGEVYYLTSYKDSLHYPDRRYLLDYSQVDNQHLMIRSGDQAQGLAAAAEGLDASLVVAAVPENDDCYRHYYEKRLQALLGHCESDVMVIH